MQAGKMWCSWFRSLFRTLIQPILWIVLSVKHNPGRSIQLTCLQIMVGCARNHPKLWRGHLIFPSKSLYSLPPMLKTKVKGNKI